MNCRKRNQVHGWREKVVSFQNDWYLCTLFVRHAVPCIPERFTFDGQVESAVEYRV